MLKQDRRTSEEVRDGVANIDIEKFTMFPNWMLKSRLSSNARLVYLALRSHDWHKTGLVWPSVATITTETALSRATVYRSLKELETHGLITNEGATAGKSVRYRLHDLSKTQIQDLCHRETPPVSQRDTPCLTERHEVDKENQKKDETEEKKTHSPASPGCENKSGESNEGVHGGTGDQSNHRDRRGHRGSLHDGRFRLTDLVNDDHAGRVDRSDGLDTVEVIPEAVSQLSLRERIEEWHRVNA